MMMEAEASGIDEQWQPAILHMHEQTMRMKKDCGRHAVVIETGRNHFGTTPVRTQYTEAARFCYRQCPNSRSRTPP